MATHDSNIVNDLNKRVITFENRIITSDVKKGKYNLK
jgi:ABC-type ATPase involved in cell division